MEKVEIANYRAFGEIVKAWAKGTEPLPATMEEFADQLAKADVGASIPERFTQVKFVQSEADTLVIKLPCKATLEAKEAELAKGKGSYPLPAFYERAFEGQPQIPDMVAFQAERIGDYTIQMCG